MHLRTLWLRAFRSYREAEFSFAPGLTVVHGDNGAGKTNLLEAVGYLATLGSFRGAPNEALVRMHEPSAIVRGECRSGDRTLLVEAEIAPGGRSRVLINKQPLRRAGSVREGLAVSVFSPDDLVIVKGGPAYRRTLLDDCAAVLHPRNAECLADLERVLRQRNALLKQAGGRLTSEIGFTLDVWDAKLASIGTAVGQLRADLVGRLRPFAASAYADIADRSASIDLTYDPAWMVSAGGLAAALQEGRRDDVRRGLSLVGPHRDDVDVRVEGRPSRTHASQGEQRSLALALRLGAHRLLADHLGTPPLLLLDDVFSELDPGRCDALIRHLPPGQALLATAGAVPASAQVDARLRIVRDENESRAISVGNPVETVDESAQESLR